MSDLLNVRIDSTDNTFRLRLESLPKRLETRLVQTIRPLTHEMLSRVQARMPTRTGRLRRQTHAYVDVNRPKAFVRGRVRVLNAHSENIAAAFGAMEYGSTGRRFPVRSYSRRGHPVEAYERRGGIKELRFLRGGAAPVIAKARQALQRVVQEFTAE
jgi:hypothetical protein